MEGKRKISTDNLVARFKRSKSIPYGLPKIITTDPRILDNGVKYKDIKDFIEIHEQDIRRYNYLENLYKGYHDIYFAPNKDVWKPDNRLVANFPRYITDTFTGYGYGVPIKVTSTDDRFSNTISSFQDSNEISDHDAEMVKRCCIYGHAWEYIYQNEYTETKVTACTPKEVFCVYGNDMKHRAIFGVRYGYLSQREIEQNGIDMDQAREPIGEVLLSDQIIPFGSGHFLESYDNPYGYIPVIEWRLNDERMGLYEAVAGLVEEYDYVLAEKANDVDYFAEAYLAILGAEVNEEQVKRLRDNRIINFYGDGSDKVSAEFKTKPSADDTQEHLLDRLENLIYQISMVANISDESFGNASSGVSLAYKLQAMSNLALSFDRKIEKSLRKRYKIFSSLSTNSRDPELYKSIDIRFTRNLPLNLRDEAETARALQGIVSDETLLSILSVVPDAKEELERINEEKKPIPVFDFQKLTQEKEQVDDGS